MKKIVYFLAIFTLMLNIQVLTYGQKKQVYSLYNTNANNYFEGTSVIVDANGKVLVECNSASERVGVIEDTWTDEQKYIYKYILGEKKYDIERQYQGGTYVEKVASTKPIYYDLNGNQVHFQNCDDKIMQCVVGDFIIFSEDEDKEKLTLYNMKNKQTKSLEFKYSGNPKRIDDYILISNYEGKYDDSKGYYVNDQNIYIYDKDFNFVKKVKGYVFAEGNIETKNKKFTLIDSQIETQYGIKLRNLLDDKMNLVFEIPFSKITASTDSDIIKIEVDKNTYEYDASKNKIDDSFYKNVTEKMKFNNINIDEIISYYEFDDGTAKIINDNENFYIVDENFEMSSKKFDKNVYIYSYNKSTKNSIILNQFIKGDNIIDEEGYEQYKEYRKYFSLDGNIILDETLENDKMLIDRWEDERDFVRINDKKANKTYLYNLYNASKEIKPIVVDYVDDKVETIKVDNKIYYRYNNSIYADDGSFIKQYVDSSHKYIVREDLIFDCIDYNSNTANPKTHIYDKNFKFLKEFKFMIDDYQFSKLDFGDKKYYLLKNILDTGTGLYDVDFKSYLDDYIVSDLLVEKGYIYISPHDKKKYKHSYLLDKNLNRIKTLNCYDNLLNRELDDKKYLYTTEWVFDNDGNYEMIQKVLDYDFNVLKENVSLTSIDYSIMEEEKYYYYEGEKYIKPNNLKKYFILEDFTKKSKYICDKDLKIIKEIDKSYSTIKLQNNHIYLYSALDRGNKILLNENFEKIDVESIEEISYIFDDKYLVQSDNKTYLYDKNFKLINEFDKSMLVESEIKTSDNKKFAALYDKYKYRDFMLIDESGKVYLKNYRYIGRLNEDCFMFSNGFSYGLKNYKAEDICRFSIFRTMSDDTLEIY